MLSRALKDGGPPARYDLAGSVARLHVCEANGTRAASPELRVASVADRWLLVVQGISLGFY